MSVVRDFEKAFNRRDVEALVASADNNTATLQRHLAGGMNAYDFVLIDCPPSLGSLTRTALAGATEVLMPIQCEYFAMEGLTQMIDVIREVMRGQNARLAFGGILLTMFDARTALSRQVAEEVRAHFPQFVFDSVVPRNVRLGESPSHGLPVLLYDPTSKGAEAYRLVAKELLHQLVASETQPMEARGGDEEAGAG